MKKYPDGFYVLKQPDFEDCIVKVVTKPKEYGKGNEHRVVYASWYLSNSLPLADAVTPDVTLIPIVVG